MIKSPIERFQESQSRRQQWEQIANSKLFEETCDYALLQMQDSMPIACSHDMDVHQQLVGARTIIRLLKTIHELKQETTTHKTQGLNYQAGV